MTDPGFRIVEQRQRTVPFLPRRTYAEYWKFSDREHTLLVEPEVASQIRWAAEEAYPDETGGLLAGRSLCDDEGRYVVISGFIEARPGSGAPAAFKIPAEDLGPLRRDIARAHPGADELGWWHSHPGPSGYSQTDFKNQRMFEREDSVGLLVFGRGPEWATAYIGPDSAHLGSPVEGFPDTLVPASGESGPLAIEPAPAITSAPASAPASSGTPQTIGSGPYTPRPPVGRRPGLPASTASAGWTAFPWVSVFTRRRVLIGAACAFVCVIAAAAAILVKHGVGFTVHRQPAQHARGAGTVSAPAPSCALVSAPPPQAGAHPVSGTVRYYTCTVSGSSGKQVAWLVNGKPWPSDNPLRITVKGPTRVRPDLVTGHGPVQGRTATLP